MKDKLIFFIAGLLLGAIISTGSIYFYTLAESNSNTNTQQMQGAAPNSNGGGMNQMGGGTPPDMPSNNTQAN